jgi:hypothetical protein
VFFIDAEAIAGGLLGFGHFVAFGFSEGAEEIGRGAAGKSSGSR